MSNKVVAIIIAISALLLAFGTYRAIDTNSPKDDILISNTTPTLPQGEKEGQEREETQDIEGQEHNDN